MDQAKALKSGFASLILVTAIAGGSLVTVRAQETTKPAPTVKKSVRSGRDPFRKYEAPAVVVIRRGGQILPPTLQERIEQYRAQKLAAMNAHLAAPKPTTALLLSEVQVVGISRTPRGYAAIVEAIPIKLSYIIYPGEKLYDGQLVAIEDARLVFRHENVFTDGRRERTVQMKALRQPNPVDAMTAVKTAPANTAVVEPEKKSAEKASAMDKP